MKKLILGLSLFLSGCVIHAQSLEYYVGKIDTIGLHTITHHEPHGSANNINPGIYVITDQGITVGTYFNSHRQETVYAGWTTPEIYRVRASLIAATGYRNSTTYLVVPSIRLFTLENGVNVRIVAGPNAYVDGQNLVHILLDWKF